MQANNILSAGRLGAYFRKHLLDNYRFYGMALIVLTGLLLLIMGFYFFNDGNPQRKYSDLIPIYLVGMFLAGGIFTSMSFSELGTNPRGIDYLLFPASHLEKFLSTLLVTVVGFLVMYHVAFYFAATMSESIAFARFGNHINNDLQRYTTDNKWWYSYYFWFIVQALFLLGAIYTHKYSFIKTVFFFLLFAGAIYLLHTVTAYTFFGSKLHKWNEHIPFVGVRVMIDQSVSHAAYPMDDFLVVPKKYADFLLFIGKYLVAPCLWTMAYFRLRDKEI
ncbi:hypothetical protein [Chitinophaga tropicalis]|uniref:Uncharacterized protein n=1 Tax=Chitinophaga tropicalis TaxID=2683588 RepID=A0A7K1U5S6_9BACT|nr:hypothetical protein [Chitinophaga tropicalis]MVT09723.1 hypothetical protein [Chitinophaga tropicalis]